MKHPLLFILATFVTVAAAFADDAVLTINTAGGASYRYLYSERPSIIPQGNVLAIKCTSHEEVTLTFDQFTGMTSSTSSEDVDAIASVKSAPGIRLQGQTLNVTTADTATEVYTIDGQLVATYPAGVAAIPLRPRTTYVVRTGKKSFKVTTK